MRETVDCTLDQFADVIATMFKDYSQEVCNGLKKETKDAIELLEKNTKADAPKDRGKYARAISSKVETESPTAITCVWYVKPPHHRLTHLLAFGHATRSGGRTRANSFLKNNYDLVKKKFDRNCEKVIDNAAN